MFEKLRNSWDLVKASASVLRADKELIIFPFISSLGVLLVTATFALPMLLTGFIDSIFEGGADILAFVVAFTFYVVQYAVIIFANSALVGAALIRLRGGDPTVGDGLRVAMGHIMQILGYALIAATVGMILRWMSERGKRIGRFASSVIGLAWNLATYLVVPVLVVEDVGPLEAVKRSAELLKRTWGEQIAGNFSIGAIFGLISFAVILLFVPVFVVVVPTKSILLIVLSAVALVLLLVLIGLVSSTLNGIYVAAVYRFAAEGDAGGYFREDLVKEAFRLK